MSTDYEIDRAIMESEMNAEEAEYFAARPQIDSMDRRRVFEAGFERAWKVLMKPINEVSNVKVRGCALLRSPSRLAGWATC